MKPKSNQHIDSLLLLLLVLAVLSLIISVSTFISAQYYFRIPPDQILHTHVMSLYICFAKVQSEFCDSCCLFIIVSLIVSFNPAVCNFPYVSHHT